MYGMAASLPDRSIVSELTGVYLDALYSAKSDLKVPNGHSDIKVPNGHSDHKILNGHSDHKVPNGRA